MSFLSRFRKNEKGQSLVEFALVLPILLALIFGIIQFGIIFNGQITATSAAREGARLAVVGGTQAEIRDRVEAALSASMLVDAVDKNNDILIFDGRDETQTIIAANIPAKDYFGEPIGVQVEIRVPIIVPLEVFGGSQMTLRSQSIMRGEFMDL